MIVMPDEALAQQQQRDQWAPLQHAYQQSVEQIMAYGADARVPQWLDTATAQLMRRAGTLQKTVLAQDLVQKLRPVPPRPAVVSMQKSEQPMNAYERLCAVAVELRKADDSLDVPASIVKAAEQSPAVYALYRAERRQGIRHVSTVAVKSVAPVTSAAYQKIQAQAAELRKVFAENGAEMSEAESISEIVAQNPALYGEYQAERRQRQRGAR